MKLALTVNYNPRIISKDTLRKMITKFLNDNQIEVTFDEIYPCNSIQSNDSYDATIERLQRYTLSTSGTTKPNYYPDE